MTETSASDGGGGRFGPLVSGSQSPKTTGTAIDYDIPGRIGKRGVEPRLSAAIQRTAIGVRGCAGAVLSPRLSLTLGYRPQPIATECDNASGPAGYKSTR
jgi:hypothetical protein